MIAAWLAGPLLATLGLLQYVAGAPVSGVAVLLAVGFILTVAVGLFEIAHAVNATAVEVALAASKRDTLTDDEQRLIDEHLTPEQIAAFADEPVRLRAVRPEPRR